MLTEKVKYKDKEQLPLCWGSGENSLISLLSDKGELSIYVTSLLWLRNMLSQIMTLSLALLPAWPRRDGCRVEIWQTSHPGPMRLSPPLSSLRQCHPNAEWLWPWKPSSPTHIFLYSIAEWRLFPPLSHYYGSARKAGNVQGCFQRILVT